MSAALVLAVHVIPSGLLITRLPVPVLATATNNDSSGDQHTEYQLMSTALVLDVHVRTYVSLPGTFCAYSIVDSVAVADNASPEIVT